MASRNQDQASTDLESCITLKDFALRAISHGRDQRLQDRLFLRDLSVERAVGSRCSAQTLPGLWMTLEGLLLCALFVHQGYLRQAPDDDASLNHHPRHEPYVAGTIPIDCTTCLHSPSNTEYIQQLLGDLWPESLGLGSSYRYRYLPHAFSAGDMLPFPLRSHWLPCTCIRSLSATQPLVSIAPAITHA